MGGIEAAYSFAGVVGIKPHGMTLDQLWRMACGRIRQRRFEMVEQAMLVWIADDIDLEIYQLFGVMEATGKGGPVQVKPELQAKIDAEIERQRREDPTLPTFGGTM